MADGDALQTYVVPVEKVRECVHALLGQEIHPFFIAYLHLRRLAGRLGRLTDLDPSWASLGALLEVPGGPEDKPFLRPFWKGQRDANQEWLNENLAGSFAPSSLRGVPMRVIEVDANGHYSLPQKHYHLAREHLLYDKPVQVLDLAGFLFRDFGIRADRQPTGDDLIALFRTEYGYGPDADEEFGYLFNTTWRGESGAWIEPLLGAEDDA